MGKNKKQQQNKKTKTKTTKNTPILSKRIGCKQFLHLSFFSFCLKYFKITVNLVQVNH